jgi:hypothetical protein
MRLVLACLLCLLTASASAAEFLTLGGVSRHFERDLDLNEVNPGLGYERDYNDDMTWSVGVFKNSLRRAAFFGTANYALWKLEDSWRAGVTAGLSSGYHHSAIVPLAMPFIEWRGRVMAVQSYIIPSVKPYVDGAVVLQFKWRLDQ